MISRAQEKTLSSDIAVRKQPKLSALEKAMLKWAVVDPEDRILDANIGSGMMAEYLRRNMQCEVCGISDNMEQVREARGRLQNCDIVYATPGDIPWREGAFDTVLMKYTGDETVVMTRTLSEAARVLKPGGQLILGTMYYPAAVSAIANMFAEDSLSEFRPFQRNAMMDMLGECSFEKITWQRTGLTTGVMIAWKSKPEVEQLLNAG
ncbi:MAG: class I SAM-dependent methyltransferase [Clostridia bacterium]|nr:class I SAM-dependent methyltransferase [Clostridia bacterium]